MEGTMSEIRLFAGNFEPKSWAYCAGQLLPISTNQALFSLLGTTYGGNGIQTFGLPDMRGRVPMGTGNVSSVNAFQLGEVTGVNNTTILLSNMPAHTHAPAPGLTLSIPAYSDSGDVGTATGNHLASLAGLYTTKTPDTTMKPISSSVTVGVTGGNQQISIQQPYLGMNYIICLYGIFPSRG